MPTATINGFRHYYEDLGSGEVLVMLHGANGSSQTLAEHFPELAQRFRVIAPDLRSLGRSEHVAALPPSAWVDDLQALLDHLDIPHAHIFGVSLGSRVAMRFAIDHPSRVRSLIITAPHTYLNHELNDAMNRFDGDGRRMPPEEQARMQRLHGDDWLDVLRNYYTIRNVPALQHYYNLRVTHPLAEVVGTFSEPVSRIACPILVVQSDNLAFGRGTFDHAIELKNEMPDRVKLAIVPALNPSQGRGVPGAELRRLLIQFVDSLAAASAQV